MFPFGPRACLRCQTTSNAGIHFTPSGAFATSLVLLFSRLEVAEPSLAGTRPVGRLQAALGAGSGADERDAAGAASRL